METIAGLYKALGDASRLRLAALLAAHGEVCVCHLGRALAIRDFNVSRHLRVLRAAGLVESRREGTWIHYRLAPPRTSLQKRLYDCLRCLRGHPTAKADAKRLADAICRSRPTGSARTRKGGCRARQARTASR